jgi:hypothetical protein
VRLRGHVAVRARGQAMVEYLVVTTVLAIALFARWPGTGSTAERLVEAVARWYRNYAVVLALG